MSISIKRLTLFEAALVCLAPLMGCETGGVSTPTEQVEQDTQALIKGAVVKYPFSGTDLIARAVVSVNGGCTATLLNNDWVITARHCVGDATGRVRQQTHTVHHYPTGTDRNVEPASVFLHPDSTVDVGLLHLPSPISSGQGSISLFTGEDADVVGKAVVTYGYGLVDFISGGCSGGKKCPTTQYFCDSNAACVLYPNLINMNPLCKKNSDCPSGYPVCDSSGHCWVKSTGSSGGLRKATFTVQKVVRDNSMQGSPVYNGKYLTLPTNGSGQSIASGDSGGPTFINGQLVGITGGGSWVAYAKVFRNWAKGIMSPATNNSISPTRTTFTSNLAPAGTQLRTGDVNGDGYTDLVQFNQSSAPQGSVYVLPGSKGGYTQMLRWHTNFSTGAQVPDVGDVNGDGKADIITFDRSNGEVWVALSNGSQFGTGTRWNNAFSWNNMLSGQGEKLRVGDVNGDGRADFIAFDHGDGTVWVSMSCGTDSNHYPPGCAAGSQFGYPQVWAPLFSSMGDVPWVGDVNNDGLADLVNFRTDGYVYVALTPRKSCTVNSDCPDGSCWTALGICPGSLGGPTVTTSWWGYDVSWPTIGETPMLADMNGDGYVDAVNFETVSSPRNGYVGVALSTGTNFGSYTLWGTGFCLLGDLCAVGDANRDGSWDVFDLKPAGADSYACSLSVP